MSTVKSWQSVEQDDQKLFLSSRTSGHWQRIGVKRRSGVCVPLFSVYSDESIGIGEIPDIVKIIDWCKACGMSIIQLLPMNDVGFTFRPYDAQSAFALDPMYLSFLKLIGVDKKMVSGFMAQLRQQYPSGPTRINYDVKGKKLECLWQIFQTAKQPESLRQFVQAQSYWLEDYVLFRVLKQMHGNTAWESWPDEYKYRDSAALEEIHAQHRQAMQFHRWLQWQLFEQFKTVKSYAQSLDVLLMGDIPFLVSRDSSDVWAHQDYFKLDLAAGAPPDMLFSKGQRWGMPPYNWPNIAGHRYDYVREKLRYAQNFYDLYRIDHFVGIFRVWTIPTLEPAEAGGLRGYFDPADESLWEEHGRKILSVMVDASHMMACAEDLGVVPECSYKLLREFGIPGIDVQRWTRDWGKTYGFTSPKDYRVNSVSVISTHDLSNLCAWWDVESGTVDEELFRRKCREKNIDFDKIKDSFFDLKHSAHGRLRWLPSMHSEDRLLRHLHADPALLTDILELYRGSIDEREKFLQFLAMDVHPSVQPHPLPMVKHALERVGESASVFSIQLISDWLALDNLFDADPWDVRINFPGTTGEKNWSLVLPLSLDDLLSLPVNSIIRGINEKAGRL